MYGFYSYFLGLLTATVSSEVFKQAQPALLYLVPFTLLPLLTMAYLKVINVYLVCVQLINVLMYFQGDLRRMWTEPFSTPINVSKQLEV